MNTRGSDLPQNLKMFRSPISLMAMESIRWKDSMKPGHRPITDDLRHDGCRCDMQTLCVSTDNGNRSYRTSRRNPRSIDKDQRR